MGSATLIRTGGMMAEPHAGREEARRLRPTRGVAHDRPVPSDVEAVTALIMAYAERLDAGDLDGVAALFADATWRSPARAEPLRGPAAVRRAYDVDATPWLFADRLILPDLVGDLSRHLRAGRPA